MSEKCVICGTDLVDRVCPNLNLHIKPMCLNCISCSHDNECESLYCVNAENKEDAMNKLLQSVPSGYQLKTFELKPLPLKDCTKKCKRWEFNKDVIEQISAMFQTVQNNKG